MPKPVSYLDNPPKTLHEIHSFRSTSVALAEYGSAASQAVAMDM